MKSLSCSLTQNSISERLSCTAKIKVSFSLSLDLCLVKRSFTPGDTVAQLELDSKVAPVFFSDCLEPFHAQ